MSSESLTLLRSISRCALLLALSVAEVKCTPFKADPAGDAGASCTHRGPPGRPNITDAGGTLDLKFAETGYTLRDDAGGPLFRKVGFDLDNKCTGEGEDNGCVEPPYATGDHTDGKDGIDNAYGQILWEAGLAPMNTGLTPVPIVRVRGYTGGPDDDQVEVSLYVGRQLVPREDGGTSPVWDGRDRWNVMSETLLPSGDGGTPSVDEPIYRDDGAYVSDHVLVTQFKEAVFTPSLQAEPALLIPVHQFVAAGTLTQVAGVWELRDLVLGGRVEFNDVLKLFAVLPATYVPNVAQCQSASTWRTVKETTCRFLDIASVAGPASTACNAVSIGILAQAKQVFLGDALPPSTAPGVSCGSGIDPATDTCDSLADE
jgi:hypothetical protein